MKNNSNIFNIHSKEIIKFVFSYLDYQLILKLIKKNKRLQNTLGINLKNIKNKSNPKYIIEKKICLKERNLRKNREPISENCINYCCLCLNKFIASIIIIYTTIYAILLISKNIFKKISPKKKI